jgi:group I intron endonuclease
VRDWSGFGMDNQSKCALYRVVHRESGKGYVGISVRVQRRWQEHCNAAMNGSTYPFHRALRKHGAAAFDWRLVAWCFSLSAARLLERVAIHLGMGQYNLTKGGEGTLGWRPGLAWRAKLRAANLGKRMSEEVKARLREIKGTPEARKKMSDFKKSHGTSAAAREKIAAAAKGNQRRLGKNHTEHSRAKMSASHKGKILSEETKQKMSASQKARRSRVN